MLQICDVLNFVSMWNGLQRFVGAGVGNNLNVVICLEMLDFWCVNLLSSIDLNYKIVKR